MSDEPNLTTDTPDQASQQDGQQAVQTASSFERRTAAWMGIAYVLMFLFVITFSMYRPDRSLSGTFPLFLVPVSAAAGVITVRRLCKGTGSASRTVTAVFMLLLCAAAAAFGLWLGLTPLLSALAG